MNTQLTKSLVTPHPGIGLRPPARLTDRELLERCARVLGLPGVYQEREDCQRGVICGIAPVGAEVRDWWNPLTDAGARYELARILGFVVDFMQCTVWKSLPDNRRIHASWRQEHLDEPHAILHVAAQMGAL